MPNMRDRLIELLKQSGFYGENECEDCQNTELCNKCSLHLDMSALADYLIENGVILPPCKIGDTIYKITSSNEIVELKAAGFDYAVITSPYNLYSFSSFGKTVFLTREEAEQALKGGAENE